MERLMSKYGFNEKRFRESKPKQFVHGEAARAALHRRYAETIKDKVGFAVEMKQLFGPVVRQMPLREAVQPTVADNINISGDRARGKILKTSIAGLSEQPVAFQRIYGRWYVELLPHKRD